jgi:protease PrsW
VSQVSPTAGTPYPAAPTPGAPFQRRRDRARLRAAGEVAGRRGGLPEVLTWTATVLMLVGGGGLSIAAIVTETGVGGLVVGVLLSLIPVVAVVATYVWLDRFENEPTSLLAFAFSWGAGVATLGALVINSASMAAIQQAGGTTTTGVVVVAPAVEEALKGAGVLLILLLNRREFDGIVDGLVYAGLVGIGFAFIEDVLYLGRTVQTHDGATAMVFVLRCLASPFAHPLFTAATGIGLGIAARTRSAYLWVLAPLAGYLVAVGLHATWNLSTTTGLRGFMALYVVVQMPVFVIFATLALLARRREGTVIARHLGTYASAGWLTTDEVVMLTTLSGRRAAQVWASGSGGRRARRAMQRFQSAASELAFLRERMHRGNAPADAAVIEQQLLLDLSAQRRTFYPSQRPGLP